MHDLPLITTIATAFTAAWLLGLLTQRLGLSPIVGYLLAGVLIGAMSTSPISSPRWASSCSCSASACIST
jgi:predicted Kef-type K+ transport protein